MGWFLDTLLGYVMTDVVDVEFRKLKAMLSQPPPISTSESAGGIAIEHKLSAAASTHSMPSVAPTPLDFTTLRNYHSNYLDRLLTGCLLAYPALKATLRSIFEVCERFVAQVERWGGDVLPALLFEGSLKDGHQDRVGGMVKERWSIVAEINEV
jgi:hypothetical protein